MTKPDGARERTVASIEAATAARRYYIDNLQKNAIAAEMGISRFKVARLIDEARSAGIVHFSVDMPTEIDAALAAELATTFKIRRAVVVHVVNEDPATLGATLGSAAASYLTTTINDNDLLGVSWGSALTHTVNALETFAAADVVQLVGGVHAGTMETSGVELVRRLSGKGLGRAFPLHAPLLVRTPQMVGELRREPSLSGTINRFSRLTAALVGIGSWSPPRSTLYNEFTPDERALLADDGAVADICSLVFDENGAPLTSPPISRSVGITLPELQNVPEVIAVAGGAKKVAAIGAALRSGVVDTLVTDIATAEHVLGH